MIAKKTVEQIGAEAMIAEMKAARPYLVALPICPYHGEELLEIEVHWTPPFDKRANPVKAWICSKCAEEVSR